MAYSQEKGHGRKRPPKKPKEKPEFDQQIVDLARVTRVTKGGKQMSFRCCVLIGDRKGRVGYGIQKGKDVQIAVEKAVRQAKKHMIRIPLIKETLPHATIAKFKAAKIMLKPAPKGSGIIAGSVIRTVLEMAGVPNASSKMLGKTNNKINNVKATFVALESFLVQAKEPKKKVIAEQGDEKKTSTPVTK
ncbi:MAG: 30S ribosomal protein S5 [Candidatus Magasanikbacteria bacterium CG11_big_fil_rev_8_21_14_0_20_43_7]|uniref:Small ribosomal subunit protein uS5 n=1 Tax=Candidatus Magasanikbacteria bacterium CG11_big_fil_rev_8_21_14_0_20_43_7 TaxID=1974654 RepID=A0A2H0N256_9BACT|nr:MAG: 30S ribosomal protein S5 [Candidatus Magasanikbacteria bacterium CG11_big_fil_rev_8_21_14_0_20_43_7]